MEVLKLSIEDVRSGDPVFFEVVFSENVVRMYFYGLAEEIRRGIVEKMALHIRL